MLYRHILSVPGQMIGCGRKTGDVVVVAWEVVISKAVVSAALEVAKLVVRAVSLVKLVKLVKAAVVVSVAKVSMRGAVVVSDAELSVAGTIVSRVVAEIASEAENDRVCVRDVLVSASTLVSVSMAAMAVVIEEVPGLHSPAAAIPAKTGRAIDW